ncbi:hypothetical protein MRB53_039098 [Persea americana]|nr:hypothetical protein MRB53_039098 [Persea americana]
MCCGRATTASPWTRPRATRCGRWSVMVDAPPSQVSLATVRCPRAGSSSSWRLSAPRSREEGGPRRHWRARAPREPPDD